MAINVSGNVLVSTNSLPVSIANGGTGATTAPNALINLNARTNTESIITTGVNTSALKFKTYVLVASGIVLTLPSSVSAGDWINVIVRNTASACSIARNSSNIMGLAEDLTLDIVDITITLIYVDSTHGWCLGQ